MAEKKKSSEKDANKRTDEKLKSKIRQFEHIMDRLEKEREVLTDAMGRDFREARRYVRLHPEESILAAMAGGLLLGFILGRLSK